MFFFEFDSNTNQMIESQKLAIIENGKDYFLSLIHI